MPFDVTVHPQKLSLCLFHRNKLNVSSRTPRSQATSERQVTFLIGDPTPRNYSYRFVCTSIHLFNTRKILEVRMSDLIGLWEPTSPLVRKATLESTVCSLTPGAKFAPVCKFCVWKQNSTLRKSAPGGNVRTRWKSSPLGAKIVPGDKVHPFGQNSPLVSKIRPGWAKFAPMVKVWP